MKRTFGKSLVFFILIVLFTLCMAVGCTTLNIAPTADDGEVIVTNPSSNVTMELNRAVLLQGGEVELTITAKMKNDDDDSRIWGSAEFWIQNTFAEYLSITKWSASSSTQEVTEGNVGGAFDSKYDVQLDKVDGNSKGFLHFYMASNNSNKKVSASIPLIIKVKMKYSETAPDQPEGTVMKFSLDKADYNFIADYNYRGSDATETGVLFTALDSDPNKLVVSDCSLQLRKAKDDNKLQSLWVSEDGIPTPDKHSTITVLEGETAKQQVTYEAEKASKDTFFIKPTARQEGAKVKVYLGDKSNELQPYIDDSGILHEGIYKATLNGDAYSPKGQIKIIISVISEAQLDDSTITVPTEFDYTLTVTQTYCGLDNIKVSSNENEKLNIAEDKKGLNPDYPSETEPTTYKVRVPMGTSNGLQGATKVNITPSVLAGYGISKSITVAATNCTANTSSLQSGGNFDVEGIVENSTVTLTIANSQGATTQITIKFEIYSIDTEVKGDIKLTYGDNKPIAGTKVGSTLKFKLPKASEKEINGEFVRVGEFSATFSDGATFVIKQNDIEVDKVGEGENAKYQLKAGDYELVVTSAAGNTQNYTISVENEIVNGEIVRFEYRIGDGEWIVVYDLDGVKDATGKQYKYNESTKTFTLNGAIDLTEVQFRFAITDNSTVSGFVDTSGNPITGNEVTGDGKYGTYKTLIYSYNNLNTGINQKVTTVNATGIGGYAYTLEVIITEADYDIIGIDIGNDSHSNPLIDFTQFSDDGTGKLTYPSTIEVPFATSKITLVVNAEGHSTQVFVNGKQLYRQTISDTAEGKPQTEHSDEIQLRDGKITTLMITYKGTDGLVTDNTKTYVIQITRKSASADNTLSGLEIYLNKDDASDTSAKLPLAFDGGDYYNIPLPQDTLVEKVFIKATPNNANATISGSIGAINLTNISTDTYRFNIIVTPENSVNGSGRKIYTIEIYAPSSNLEITNTLKELQIIGENVNYLNGANKFEESKTDYSVSVPYNTNKINLIAVAKGNASSLTITLNDNQVDKDSALNLNVGNNTLKIKVQPQHPDATPLEYVVHITRQESKGSAQLNSLNVVTSKGTPLMNGMFNKTTYSYELNVNSSTATDNLDITLTAPQDAIVTVTCDNNIFNSESVGTAIKYNIGFIDYGTSKIYLIKVVLDDSEVTYTLKINREKQTPSLNTLVITQNDETNGLTLYDKDGKNEVQYDKEVYEYSVKVFYDIATKLTITATAPTGVTISGIENPIDINALFGDTAGTKVFTFSISNGVLSQQYTIYITRLANPAGNANIKNITISKISEFKFSSDVTSYGPYTLDNATDLLQPKVECENENATTQIFVNGTLADNNIVNLAIGENNIKIVVTAQNGVDTKEVYIRAIRKHPSISNVTVTDSDNTTLNTGVTINDDINAYSFTVGKDVDKINLNLGLANGYTQKIVSGDANNLKVGEFNKITVEVRDSNNQLVRTIEFNVFRENPADYTMWFIIAGVLGGIILILLILTIVAFTKGGKNKKKGNINDIGIGDYELD